MSKNWNLTNQITPHWLSLALSAFLFKKIKKYDAAPKVDAGGDEKRFCFFMWPYFNAIQKKKKKKEKNREGA